MQTIRRHETWKGTDFARSQLADIRPTVPEALSEARSHPWYLEGATSVLQMLVTYALVVDPESTDPAVRGQVALMAEHDAAIFACVAAPREAPVETVVGEPLSLWGTGLSPYASAPDWLYAFSYATVARRPDLLDLLCRVPEDGMRAIRGNDEYVQLWVEALRIYRLSAAQPDRTDRVLDAVDRCLARTTPDHTEVTSGSQIRLMEQPLLRALRALVVAEGHRDAPVEPEHARGLNRALVSVLDGHRELWGAPSRCHQSLHFVAWQALALVCLAIDRGIEITVRSDYLPPVLLQPPTPSAAADYYCSVIG